MFFNKINVFKGLQKENMKKTDFVLLKSEENVMILYVFFHPAHF